MRRLLAISSAGLLAAAAFTGQAAATHGGAEHRATGTGATSTDVTTQTPIFAQCFFFGIPVFTQVGATTRRTVTAETFSFSSRLTTEEAEDVLLSEPHGQMRYGVQQTVTTTSQVTFPSPGTGLTNCIVIGGVPPNTTVTRSATATAEVTCLSIVNNRAAIGGHVTRFEGDFPPTRGLLFNATDNTIASQQVAPDQFSGALIAEAPQACPPPSADHPITEGDILVEHG